MTAPPHRQSAAAEADAPVTRRELEARIDEARTGLRSHMDARFDELERMLSAGFPAGDMGAHRKVHEGYIQEAEDRRRFWTSIKEKLVTAFLTSAMFMVIAAVWQYALTHGALR